MPSWVFEGLCIMIAVLPMTFALHYDQGAHRERYRGHDGVETSSLATTSIVAFAYGAVLLLIGIPWIAVIADSRGDNLPSTLVVSGVLAVSALAFALVGAALRRKRIRVCIDGIVRKNVWGKQTIVGWDEIKGVGINWLDTMGGDELPKRAPNAEVRLEREMDHPIVLMLGSFPSRRAVVEIVLANLSEGAHVEPNVYEYLGKLKRMAQGAG